MLESRLTFIEREDAPSLADLHEAAPNKKYLVRPDCSGLSVVTSMFLHNRELHSLCKESSTLIIDLQDLGLFFHPVIPSIFYDPFIGLRNSNSNNGKSE